MQFEHLEFENSEFENSEFKNSEFENSELKSERAFFMLGSGSKTFLRPTYVDNQLWFRKNSLNFLF